MASSIPILDDETIIFLKKVVDEVTRITIEHLPTIKRTASETAELIFGYKMILRQLLLAVILESGAMTVSQVVHIGRAFLSNFSARSRQIRRLQNQLQTAESQDEWMEIAERIDAMQDDDKWRSDPNCALYESDRIRSRIDELVHLMRRRDIFDLMFTLRGGIGRNKFGLLHEGLFTKAMAGTKLLIETYHNVVCTALDFVCDAPVLPGDDPIPTDLRLAFFNETRHSYGRTALMVSGGAALGFYHVGVVKTLMENGLMPRVLSGASAGSIVCSMIATRTNEECLHDLFHVRGTNAKGHSGSLCLDFFRPVGYAKSDTKDESKGDGITKVFRNTAGAFTDVKKVLALFTPIGVRNVTSKLYDIITGRSRPKDLLMSDTEHFRQCCRTNIGDFTFQEAFDRTGRILNIIVCPQNRSDPPRLLNYLTSPHVLVWSAAVASSSLPGVFEANKLLVKDSDGSERVESSLGGRFLDGSMEADLPMQQLSEMFNINHFIISQANPHAVMFSSLSLDAYTNSIWINPVIGVAHGILLFIKNQVRAWLRNMVDLIGGRRIAPIWETKRNFMSHFFTQEYEGRDCDITINPWAGHRSLFSAFMHVIYNPCETEFLEWVDQASRVTWKYIPAIKSHIAEEMTLDRCVQRLRKRVLAESWEHQQQQTIMSTHHQNQINANSIKHTNTETPHDKISKRVPSFFTSPSLVNMGGLGVHDQINIHDWNNHHNHNTTTIHNHDSINEDEPMLASGQSTPKTSHNQIELSPGWGGMGLRGNHSHASFNSAGSGLFFFDGEEGEDIQILNNDAVATTTTIVRPKSPIIVPTPVEPDIGYIKTTNMANFYYRRTKSHNFLDQSVHGAGDASPKGNTVDGDLTHHRRDSEMSTTKKANSLMDLSVHGKRPGENGGNIQSC